MTTRERPWLMPARRCARCGDVLRPEDAVETEHGRMLHHDCVGAIWRKDYQPVRGLGTEGDDGPVSTRREQP